ncbi:carboxypeptidase-like regulatory domain-containing protein, partial [Coprobacter fastidiosus]
MKIKLYIFFIFLFIGSTVLAQSRIKISGKVIDADNQGLELVNVRIGGTTQGTLTDLKGEYELTVASQDSIEIIFSCLGYRTEKRILAAPQGNVVLNMRLYTKDKKLGEVVVTEIRKQTSTLQKIDAKDLRLMPDASGGS